MKKTTATGSKHISHIAKCILLIFKKCLIFLKIPLMASLNILCSDLHNFLKEVAQKKKKKKKK